MTGPREDGRPRGDGSDELVRRTGEATVRQVRDRIRGPVHQRVTLGLRAMLVVGTALDIWRQRWIKALGGSGSWCAPAPVSFGGGEGRS